MSQIKCYAVVNDPKPAYTPTHLIWLNVYWKQELCSQSRYLWFHSNPPTLKLDSLGQLQELATGRWHNSGEFPAAILGVAKLITLFTWSFIVKESDIASLPYFTSFLKWWHCTMWRNVSQVHRGPTEFKSYDISANFDSVAQCFCHIPDRNIITP